jgi:putative acetyltransferase
MSETRMSETRIRPFQAGDEDAFRRLNQDWIERYFRMEEKDHETLADPRGRILDAGGAILIAEADGEAVGCCALIPMQQGAPELELAKMAVAPEYQGRGLGQGLIGAAVEAARDRGARRVILETNSKLGPALRLYERMGFVRIAPLHESEYSRSDVWMELKI